MHTETIQILLEESGFSCITNGPVYYSYLGKGVNMAFGPDYFMASENGKATIALYKDLGDVALSALFLAMGFINKSVFTKSLHHH